MEEKKKCIAVMTSGGDAPGMNAAIVGVYRRAKKMGYEVLGIRDGFTGLLKESFCELRPEEIESIGSRGGTILGTSRCKNFLELKYQRYAAGICRNHGISDVVVIGGDGSFQGAQKLHEQGIGVVGIPGTIDLDIGCTDYTIGFDTAVSAALEAIDRIWDTTRAHKCYSVVEVMGRRSGHIAMWCGIANSARAVIIPERNELDGLIEKLKKQERHYGMVVIAEGAGKADEVAKRIQDELHVHTRSDVLGFLQRGGAPTCRDRVYGCRMGSFAVDLIRADLNSHIVAVHGGVMEAIEIRHALTETRDLPAWVYNLANTICG